MPEQKMSEGSIKQVLLGNIKAAQRYTSKAAEDRSKFWDRYYGRPLGNERKGRSQYMSKDIMDTVEWMLPHFMRTFFSGDPKIDLHIDKQSPIVGKALRQKILDDLEQNDPNLFRLGYQWVKDALVSDTAVVKHSWDAEMEQVQYGWDMLGQGEMDVLQQDPQVTVDSYGEMQNPWTGQSYYSQVGVTIERAREESVYCENVPHWEFIVSPRARGVNDEFGKGIVTEVTVDYLKRVNQAWSKPGEPFFRDLELVEAEAPASAYSMSGEDYNQEGERGLYMDNQDLDSTSDNDADRSGPSKVVKLIEWYDRIDLNGDGLLEDCTAWFVEGRMIRYEQNEEGMVPFSVLSPMLDCYKFFGLSYAELLVELQNLKTMLFRRILDNFDFTNQGRWLVDPNGDVNIRALLENAPGEIIFGKTDAVTSLAPQPMDLRVLSLMEYVDTIKENRTGVTRYNQGMDADSLNKTATGIAQIQSAAQQRIDLVGRVFAETGFRDFWAKCAKLYQLHMTKPFTVDVDGQQVQVTPEMIQGKISCKINLGIESMIGQQETQKIERVTQYLMLLGQRFPALVGPQQVHSMATRYVAAMGFGQVEDFVPPVQMFQQMMQQQQQQAQEMQKMQMGMQQAAFQADMQAKQGKLQLDQAKMQQDGQIDRAKIAQDEAESKRDARMDLVKMLMEMGQKQVVQSEYGAMGGVNE